MLVQRQFYTLGDVAKLLRKSPRWLSAWLRRHPTDRYGEPFYSPMGRTKTFDDSDVARIRAAAREEEQCRLNSSRRKPGARRTTTSGAATSELLLIEARKLLSKKSQAS
jgi:hypothetical protein